MDFVATAHLHVPGTMWGAQTIAKLAKITPISQWFLVLRTILAGMMIPYICEKKCAKPPTSIGTGM